MSASLPVGAVHWSSALVVVAAAVAGVVVVRRARSPFMRRWMLLCGLGALVVAFVGPLARVAEERSMAMHMVQHLLLLTAVPALVLGGAPQLGERLFGPRALALGRTPSGAAACLAAGMAAVYLLHLPVAVDAGLGTPWLNDLQHLALVVAGVAIAWPLLSPKPLLGFAAVWFLVAGEILFGFLGIVLAWSPSLLYEGYGNVERLGGLSPADDQAVAGAILLVVEEPLLLAELAVLFIRALD